MKYKFLYNYKKNLIIDENQKFNDISFNEMSKKINLINTILNPKNKIKFKIINGHLVRIFLKYFFILLKTD